MVKVIAAALVLLVGPLMAVAGLALTAAGSTTAGGTSLPGLSPVAVAAYRGAVAEATRRWECQLPASLLGGIGAVESGHGTADGATIDPSGVVSPPVLGPVLDGSGLGGNHTPIVDSDRGRLDGHRVYDRAVGPMQLLPATWRAFAGAAGGGSPHNYHDAALAAAWHLCGGRARDLTDRRAARAALLDYNASPAYVEEVLAEQSRLAPLLDAGGAVPADRLLDHPRFTASPRDSTTWSWTTDRGRANEARREGST